MEFIRNSEVKRQIVVSSILTLFWCGISIIVDSKAVWIVLSAIISSSAVSLFFTYQRYKKIADLSLYIDRLLHGDETISFEQFQEGELSVLHDEISKMTRRLIEQAEALKIEKGNLADALADISHQLKTPLTSLNILNASLCNEELTEEERYELIRKQAMLLSKMEWLIGCRNDYPKATRGISKRCSGKSNSPSGDCGRIKNADNQKRGSCRAETYSGC